MIRLTAIELENFKNVEFGRVRLSSKTRGLGQGGSDIVGIYGQNGSGKTSVVRALHVLRVMFAGDTLGDDAAECISIGCQDMRISIDGDWYSSGLGTKHPGLSFRYRVRFRKEGDSVMLAGESLLIKNWSADKPVMKKVFEYDSLSSGDSFEIGLKPATAWNALFKVDKQITMDYLVAKRVVAASPRSLLFSREFDAIVNKLQEQAEGHPDSLSQVARTASEDLLTRLALLKNSLTLFAYCDMAVLPPARQAESMFNVLHISTHEGELGSLSDTAYEIDLNRPVKLSDEHFQGLKATILAISTVLESLVPGLTLNVVDLGKEIGPDGEGIHLTEITASRSDVEVPLRYESEGIKKLVAILILLVDVYAKPGACVVIDELDSGVFEYLLGEILQVLQDHGKGQLIFTAHNLRPLETISKNSLVFTTTNSKNRFVEFTGSQATNNLRNQYLRAINLGGQSEIIYEPTSKYEIDSAFYDAGEQIADGEAE